MTRSARPVPTPQPTSPEGGLRTSSSDAGGEPGHRLTCHRGAVVWGVAVGVGTAATPVAFWWLPAITVYAVCIAFIAAVYLGFAVADGRRHVVGVEVAVASIFVLISALAIVASPWLVVAGLAGHGLKDLWQHRTHFVANTRWWPPFCATVDWVAALIVTGAIIAGASLP